MREYTFVPHEVRLLPRHEVTYEEVDPSVVAIPEKAISDAKDAEKKAPRFFHPSPVVDLYNVNGTYFIASTGAKAYRDALAIAHAKELGEKVKAKVYVIQVGDPELYLRLNYGDILEEETFKLEASNLSPASNKVESTKMIVEALEEDSDIYAYLYDYATGAGAHMKKIPLLVGHTGVGKSAIVKKLENEEGPDGYGFRVHTIKAGFIDKADLLGYVQVKEDPDLGRVAQDSPMYELMISTDATVEAARELLKHIDENTLTYNDGRIRQKITRKEYERVKFLARTPVLFFDEINRADPFIIATLMTLFSERKLNNYSFGKAVFVTAANWPIDISAEELETLYRVELIQDPAQLDRFIVFRVSHEDDTVVSATIQHLAEKYATLPGVEEFLSRLHANNVLYNPALALDTDAKYANTAFGAEGLSKFPTFRGWDDVLKYLSVKYASKEPVYLDFIAGLVGNAATDEAIPYIRDVLGLRTTTSAESGEDVYDVFLRESFKSGLPALLIGRFGLAKSAKVKKLADDNDALFYRVDLQAMDRTTLRGYPDKQDLGSVAIGGSLGTLFKAKLDAMGTPLYTTRFVPFDFLRVVQEARETGKHLVVMFDEMNRAEPVEQSAVFDAISEGQILGVDVSDLQRAGRLHIIAAGNIGDEYAAEDFDAAAVARFALVTKNEVTDRDYESFLRWAKENFHPTVVSWLESERDYFVQLLNRDTEVSEGLVSEVFSFRTLGAINAAVASLAGTYVLSSFMDQITEEVAIAAASSRKWRGNAGPPVKLRYRLVDGPNKGQVKRYSSFLEVINDLDELPKAEVVSDVIALDAKRMDQALGFVKAAVPSDVWLQISDQIRDLIAAISRDAYESDPTAKEVLGHEVEELKDSLSGSIMSLYDKIAKDIQSGKGIDSKTLYQAALERYIESGGSEETFGYKAMLAMIREVVEEIDKLGLADVSGVKEAIELASRESDSGEPAEIIITPSNIKKEIARLSALASALAPGSVAIVEDFAGFADATIEVRGKTLTSKIEPKGTGVIRLDLDGKVFGASYASTAAYEGTAENPEEVITFDGKSLTIKTLWSETEDYGNMIKITFRGFDFEKESVSKLPELSTKLADEIGMNVVIPAYIVTTVEPDDETPGETIVKSGVAYLSVVTRAIKELLNSMMPS